MKNRTTNALVEENRSDGRGHRIAWRYDADASGTVVTSGTGADPWYFFVYDDKWRSVATIREGDSNPKERFVYHAAGADGRGPSSYTDDVILRDADRTNAWTAAAASTLGNRVYYLQNQHHDVSVLMNPNGTVVERVKYSAYGVPYGIVAADFNHDGVVDDDDFTVFSDSYNSLEIPPAIEECDLNVDGFVNDVDFTLYSSAYDYDELEGSGPGKLSRRSATLAHNTDNRIGYAGYSWSPVSSKNYVRFRVYEPGLGAWLTRDPLGYRDTADLYEYVLSGPSAFVDPMGTDAGWPGRNKGGEPQPWGPKPMLPSPSPATNPQPAIPLVSSPADENRELRREILEMKRKNHEDSKQRLRDEIYALRIAKALGAGVFILDIAICVVAPPAGAVIGSLMIGSAAVGGLGAVFADFAIQEAQAKLEALEKLNEFGERHEYKPMTPEQAQERVRQKLREEGHGDPPPDDASDKEWVDYLYPPLPNPVPK